MAISSGNVDTILAHLVNELTPESRKRLDEALDGNLDGIVGDPRLAQDRARFFRDHKWSPNEQRQFNRLNPEGQRMAMDAANKRKPDPGKGFAERFPEASNIGFAR